jgi:hypothetical protein
MMQSKSDDTPVVTRWIVTPLNTEVKQVSAAVGGAPPITQFSCPEVHVQTCEILVVCRGMTTD